MFEAVRIRFPVALLCGLLWSGAAAAQQSSQERGIRVVTEVREKGPAAIPRGYALIVGIDKYKNLPENSQLLYTVRDADLIYKTLISPKGGNFRVENVHRLTGADATYENLVRELEEWLPSMAGPDDRVLIYFAGHGFVGEDGQAYLAPYDLDPNRIAETGYSMSRLGEVIGGKIQAHDKILVTDSCHSGAITPQAAERINLSLSDLSTSTFVLSASRDRESSIESPDFGGGHGVFTYFVVQGMEGQADEDSDGIITADELAEYTRYNVRRATNRRQTPTSDRGSFDPNMLVAYVPPEKIGEAEGIPTKFGALVFESNMDGVEIYLDGESQGVVNKDEPLRLPGLAPGPHTVQGVKRGYEPDGPREEIVYPGQERTVTIRIQFIARRDRAAVEELDKAVKHYTDGGSKNYQKAAERLEQALQIDPKYSEAALYLGRVYAALFENQKARQAFERAIAIDPDYLEARASFGGFLLDIGDVDEAIRQLVAVTQRDPEHALGQRLLAQGYLRKGMYEETVRAARKAVARDPGGAEAYLALADALRFLGDKENDPARLAEAVPEYTQYLRLSDFDSSTVRDIFNHWLRGFLIGGGSKTRSSQADIWKVMRWRAYLGRGDAKRLLGQHEEAIPDIEKAVSFDGEHPRGYYTLALTYARLGEKSADTRALTKAKENFERVVELAPSTVEAEMAQNNIAAIEQFLARK